MLRRQLGYLAGSLAVGWCAASLVVAAGPGSDTMAAVYPVFEPFLAALDLEHDWGFFAPNPGTGHVVRYEVESTGGKLHRFALTEALDRWDPAYFRFTTLYTQVSLSHGKYADGATRLLCRRHRELEPVSVRIVIGLQRRVSPEDYLDGKGTTDNLRIVRRDARPCPNDEVP